jgi:acetolactate decarboxylase
MIKKVNLSWNNYFLSLCLLVFSFNSLAQDSNKNTLFQYSTINALIDGIYDGDYSVKALTRHGNFGLGTFNGLDGEMIVLDGVCYKAKSDSLETKQVVIVSDTVKTPFVAVTDFLPDTIISINSNMSITDIEEFIDSIVPSRNLMYAIKVTGQFMGVKFRSVAKQQKPYVHLTEAVKKQSVFEYKNIMGNLIGFKMPAYIEDINVPGYHWHFLSADKSKGGHVLQCSVAAIIIEIDYLSSFQMELPTTTDFLKANLKSKKNDLDIIEKGK